MGMIVNDISVLHQVHFSTGIGLGAQVVSGFAESHKQAIASGFPDNIDTHGLISGEGNGEPDIGCCQTI